MSMTAVFVSVPVAKWAEFQDEPDAVAEYLMQSLEQQDQDSVLDVDKSWHGIHFLLTGKSYGGEGAIALPVLGGEEIGGEVGYGAARHLSPQQVQAAAGALSMTPVEKLRACYEPAELEAAEIYPVGIWEDEGDEGFEYLAHWYLRLQSFYAAAAERGDGMLLAIV